MKPFLVINAKFQLDALYDPWGDKLSAIVIKDIIFLTKTEEFYEYPDPWVERKTIKTPVYISDEGRKFYGYHSGDYFAKTQYLALDKEDEIKCYEKPDPYSRYIYNGSPAKWDEETQSFKYYYVVNR